MPYRTMASRNSAPFSSFVHDYFHGLFTWEPSRATAAGIHDYDAVQGDRSREACADRIATLGDLGGRLERLKRTHLGEEDRLDLELLEGRIEVERLDLETMETWRRSPIDYVWLASGSIDGLMRRNFAPPRIRLEALTSRLRATPQVFEAMKANIENPPKESTELAIRIASGSIDLFGSTIEAWAREASDGDTSVFRDFQRAHTSAFDAIESAADWLREDLLPRSEGDYAIGEQALKEKLWHEEMTDLSLADLLAVGEATLDRDLRDFVDTAERIDGNRTPSEVMRSLSDEHPSEDDLLVSAEGTLRDIVGFLETSNLVTIPSKIPPSIVETPPYFRFGAFAAMDTPGAYETKAREAFYYVTPPETDWSPEHREEHLRLFNRPVLEIITIHEAYPGHYVQFLNAPHFPTRTRRLLTSMSNVEGWAHYTEQMMVEEGYREGDLLIRLAQLQEALLRDCRLIVALKLHTGGMTVEEAAQFFVENAFQEPANALEEARRGTLDPMYLSYTLGKLQICKLRDDWRSKSGVDGLSQFHDTFLREGGIPIRLARRRMLGVDEASTLYDPSRYREARATLRDR